MQSAPAVILLVEDDLSHAEIVKRHFSESRIANLLVHVKDGQEALDYLLLRNHFNDPLKAPRPGMVLLDLRMPKVDGLDVLRTIKADPGLSSISVVILTTSSSERDVAMAYEYHANSYLVKPTDFKKFADMMDTLGAYWLTWNQRP